MIEGLLGQQILQADNQRKNRVFSLDYTTSSTVLSRQKKWIMRLFRDITNPLKYVFSR